MLYKRILKSEINNLENIKDLRKKADNEIQFYLAVDGNSTRFFVGKKSDTELYVINEKTTKLHIISNKHDSELRLVGECDSRENNKANEIVNESLESKIESKNVKDLRKKVANEVNLFEEINKKGFVNCNSYDDYTYITEYLYLHDQDFKVINIDSNGDRCTIKRI